MSLADCDWQPNCSLAVLRLRADLLRKVRTFFWERSVLEVETPLLSACSGTDPNLDFFTTTYDNFPYKQTFFLQTSPEFAMKRLLSAGSGSIYQIGKAFRNGEAGRYHNPEFTLLEWYRVGYDLAQLMDEITELMTVLYDGIKPLGTVQRVSYKNLFHKWTGLDCLAFSYEEYSQYALQQNRPDAIGLCGKNHGLWLDYLFSHEIQPHLGNNTLCLVYGYPVCQSSLARVSLENPLLTERVELFIDGIELGNGYYELKDVDEQTRRFEHEITLRQLTNRPVARKDERFLSALSSGLPDCSGMAIGLDRLLMVLLNSAAIDEVLAFSIARA